MPFFQKYISCGLIVITIVLNACQNNSSAQSSEKEEASTTSATQESGIVDQAYLIEGKGILGITTGASIASKADLLEKSLLQDGEGDFIIYNIKNENGEVLGYLLPDPLDEKVVGNIIITSPKVQTIDGLGVGTTFQQLEEKLGDLEVHGSEIEGRTYAKKDNLSYRLKDIGIWTYEVDKSSIAPETEIMEIVIRE